MLATALQRRRSWASSLVTGLVGRNGFAIIVALAMGFRGSVGWLCAASSAAAIAQVVLLRLGFFALGLDRGLARGFLWGGVTGAALGLVEVAALGEDRAHALACVLTAIYVGIPVGGFLAYFYRDDRAIEAERPGAADWYASSHRPSPRSPQAGSLPLPRGEGAHKEKRINYGRDAHWLEPFAFGAVAYLVVFLPRSLDLGVYVFVVGAMSGVFAAGASHFSPDRWKRRAAMAPVVLAAGAVQGTASGLLFHARAGELRLSHLALGAIAGAATYAVTFLRGRQLARRKGH